MPAGALRRKFGFERLPDFDPGIWQQVKREARKEITPLPPGLLSGSDISRTAIRAAKANCLIVDRRKTIRVAEQDVFKIDKIEGKVILCNPPYGIRLKPGADLPAFYKKFGDFLKKRCSGSTAYVYFGERKYIKNIGLKPSWKRPFAAGGLDGRLVKYDLY